MNESNIIIGLNGLAKYLCISRSTAYRLVRSGALNNCCYRVGKLLRFDREMIIPALKAVDKVPWDVRA